MPPSVQQSMFNKLPPPELEPPCQAQRCCSRTKDLQATAAPSRAKLSCFLAAAWHAVAAAAGEDAAAGGAATAAGVGWLQQKSSPMTLCSSRAAARHAGAAAAGEGAAAGGAAAAAGRGPPRASGRVRSDAGHAGSGHHSGETRLKARCSASLCPC